MGASLIDLLAPRAVRGPWGWSCGFYPGPSPGEAAVEADAPSCRALTARP